MKSSMAACQVEIDNKSPEKQSSVLQKSVFIESGIKRMKYSLTRLSFNLLVEYYNNLCKNSNILLE